MIFPNSNLPVASQAWGREITKQLSDIIDITTTNEINNAARDNQLNSAIIAIGAAATSASNAAADALTAANTANSAIDGLVGLGSTGSGYTINADNINAGTITGITVQTGSTGRRTVLSGTNISFYDTGGGFAGDITGGSASGEIDITSSGAVNVNNTFKVVGATAGAVTILTNGSMQRTQLIGGGTTTASFDNNGFLQRTTSSERYKQDIKPLSISLEDILKLQPKSFRLRSEVADDENAREYAGFIAEELAGTPLDIFVAYEQLEDGSKRPDGVYYQELTAALLLAIKEQDKTIKALDARLSALESK